MPNRSPNSGSERGFTLLEVLVALAIVTIALGAIIKSAGDAARNTAYLRDKTLAHWVAQNRMAELRASRSFPATGTRSGTEEQARADWEWIQTVSESGQPGVRRVEIEVRKADADGEPLVRLSGFTVQQITTGTPGG